jgi:(p)ppGpp synthase/HD superfamily hydrolase
VPVHSISARETKDGNCEVIATVSVEGVEHLRSVINKIDKIPGAYHVERINR